MENLTQTSQTWFLQLTKNSEGEDYMELTLSEGCGFADDSNEYMRVSGICSHSNARKMAAANDLLAACVEFVRKVDTGEARSTRSYNQMKAAIQKATQP